MYGKLSYCIKWPIRNSFKCITWISPASGKHKRGMQKFKKKNTNIIENTQAHCFLRLSCGHQLGKVDAFLVLLIHIKTTRIKLTR